MNIQDVALERSINMLKGIGAQYKITMPGGRVFESAKPVRERIRKERTFPHGALKAHYQPYIEDMQPGDIASIPFDQFKPEQLRSSVTASACNMWGNGNHMSSVNKKNSTVEIMRIA